MAFYDHSSRSESLPKINNQLGKDGGQSYEIAIPQPDRLFVEYEDEWKEQEDEDDGYYDTLGDSLGDACVNFELIRPPQNLVEEMVERFVIYWDQDGMYYRAVVTVLMLLTNLKRKYNGLLNQLAAAREATAKAIRSDGEARASMAETIAARDNFWTELVEVRNFLTLFRE